MSNDLSIRDDDFDTPLFPDACHYTPTSRPWRDIHTDPRRMLRSSSWVEEEEIEDSKLIILWRQFPELLSGWPGLLLRHLPVKTIMALSRCCKKLRHLCQDPTVWKLLCALAWPGCRRSELDKYNMSWRFMYIHRPRVRSDGIYVVKWSTLRYGTDEGHGSKEAGKNFYRPVIITCMFRVIYFVDGQRFAMITNNTDSLPPDQVVKRLRRVLASRKATQSFVNQRQGKAGTLVQGAVFGLHRIQADTLHTSVSYVLESNPLAYPVHSNMRLQLSSTSPGSNDRLTALSHTTGREENDTLYACELPALPYSFLPFHGGYVGAKLMALPGWPECHIGDAMPKAVQEGGVEDTARG